jgi:DNA polymerase-3 subunit alpha
MFIEADKRFTKQGREIGVGKLEDLNGTVEVMMFSHALNKCRAVFVPDKLVTVKGKVKRREDGNAVIWADYVEEFSKQEQSVQAKKICFYFDRFDSALLDELQEILLAYPGIDETYVKAPSDLKALALEIKVNVCDSLLSEVTGLLGEGCYKAVT